MGENSKDRLSFLLDSYLQGREDSTELLYGGRSAAQRQDDTSGASGISGASDISGALKALGASGAVGGLDGLPSEVTVETGSSQRNRVLSILDDFLEEAGVDSDVLELGMPAQDYVRNFLENLPDAPVTGLEKDIRDKTGRLLDAFLSAGSENLNIGCDALRNVSAGAGNSLAGAGDSLTGSGNSLAGAGDSLTGSGNSLNGAGDSLAGAGETESDYSDDSGDSGLDGRANHFEEAFFTETLAEIFMKQHRYDKALEIIRSLYLNFPNKSIYFADQIRYLEKLIRINQISK